MPERVLIYGGTGFCGSHLAEACLEAGDEVAVTARKPRPWLDQHQGRIRFIPADITDPSSVRRAPSGARLCASAKPGGIPAQGITESSASRGTAVPVRTRSTTKPARKMRSAKRAKR